MRVEPVAPASEHVALHAADNSVGASSRPLLGLEDESGVSLEWAGAIRTAQNDRLSDDDVRRALGQADGRCGVVAATD